MVEVWKDIQGYEGLYQISNLGNVKSLNYRGMGYEKALIPKVNNSGRLWVDLRKYGKGKPMLIHRLVGEAFIPNPNNLPQINHMDENPQNNRVDNLEWCTASYNVQYSVDRHPGRYRGMQTDQRVRKSKLKDRTVNQIDMSGKVVKQWRDPRTIVVELGYNQWSITQCCDGKRGTAYGFRWQYAI